MATEAIPTTAQGDVYTLDVTAGSDSANSATLRISVSAMDGEWSEAGKDTFVQNLVDSIAAMPEVATLGNPVYAVKRREQMWRIHPTETEAPA